MTDPLFLKFCSWFLCSKQKYITFKSSSIAFENLKSFCVGILNCVKLDTQHTAKRYPAMDIRPAYASKDELHKNFLGDVLKSCNITRCLLVKDNDPLDFILKSLGPLLNSITSIQCQNTQLNPIGSKYHVRYINDKEILINTKNCMPQPLKEVLSNYAMPNSCVHLHFVDPRQTVEEYPATHIKTLHLERVHPGQNPFLLFALTLHLTHLCLEKVLEVTIMQNFIKQLSSESKKKTLIGLKYLDLINCNGVKESLGILFESTWPELRYINLRGTELTGTDLVTLSSASKGSKITLPKLESLYLTIPSTIIQQIIETKFFRHPWLNLRRLWLDTRRNKHCYKFLQGYRSSKTTKNDNIWNK